MNLKTCKDLDYVKQLLTDVKSVEFVCIDSNVSQIVFNKDTQNVLIVEKASQYSDNLGFLTQDYEEITRYKVTVTLCDGLAQPTKTFETRNEVDTWRDKVMERFAHLRHEDFVIEAVKIKTPKL